MSLCSKNVIPPALVEEFNSNRVVLFVGSGISRISKLPDWSMLLTQLQHLHERSEEFDHLDPMQQAQCLYDAAGRQTVTRNIASIFEKHRTPSDVHNLIVKLPFRAIITTNWNTLIEKAYEDVHGFTIPVVYSDDSLVTMDSSSILLKVHGSIDKPDSIVFAEEDYYDRASSETLISLYVKTLIATSTILFIGYGLRDFDIKLMNSYVWNKLDQQFAKHRTNAYILLHDAKPLQACYVCRRNFTPIIFTGETETEATKEFLKKLSKHVSISTNDYLERLEIIYRESTRALASGSQIVIRNHSNLGPLATPDTEDICDLCDDEKALGDEQAKKLAQWEIKCAKSWKQLLAKASEAKCMLCLDEEWLRQSPAERRPAIKKRLQTLQLNL